MTKELVTQSSLAKMLNVSRQVISKLCKTRLESALVGKKLDIDHPAIVEYIEEKEAQRAAMGL